MTHYDENAVLWDYVWGWYSHLLTPHEGLVMHTYGVAEKTERMSPGIAALVRQRETTSGENDPAVQRDLAEGIDAFKRRAFDRLMADCSDLIEINRCPKCNRVVRTPVAQQCLWCGHDWHETDNAKER